MKKLLFLFILIITTGQMAWAQEKSNRELKADHHFYVYAFDKAIVEYLGASGLSIGGQRNLAISYHKIGENIQAENVYRNLANTPGAMTAEDQFNYAMVLKANGKYTEANVQLDKFSTQRPDDQRAKSYLNTGATINDLAKDEGRYSTKDLDINSSADDYAANYYKNGLVFSSDRATAKFIVKKYSWTGKPFTDMYRTEIKGNELKHPVNFDKKLNGVLHDGPVSFTADYTTVAFTKNNVTAKKKDEVVTIQIYFSNFQDGKWTAPTAFPLNSATYSVGHPCLTADGQTLYFTSDMPGGYGAADIYSVSKQNGTWGNPKNLGPQVNTEADEMFPFIDVKNNLLYFSSNGLCGLGGLDVFICRFNGAKLGNAYNPGYPINTQYDDFAAVAEQSMQNGYFSSNRPGGKGGDDLYSFGVLKELPLGKKLIGKVKDDHNNAISQALVTLSNEQSVVLDTTLSDENGSFIFLVDGNKNLSLTAKKISYTDGYATASTFGKEQVFKVDITLGSTDTVIIIEKELIAFSPIYYDLNKASIKTHAADMLDKIVVFLNENPTMAIELSSYTDCRETKSYNQALSNRRAQSAANYLKKNISNPNRVTSKGYGESDLVNDCACEGKVRSTCSEEEHQKNRRTEFVIVSN